VRCSTINSASTSSFWRSFCSSFSIRWSWSRSGRLPSSANPAFWNNCSCQRWNALGANRASSHILEIGILSIKWRRKSFVFSSALQCRRSFFKSLAPILSSAKPPLYFSLSLTFQLNRNNIIKALLRLRQQNHEISIGHWGYEEMLAKLRKLNLQDLESWFGPSLTMEANVSLGFQDLLAVLQHIKVAPAPAATEVKDVSRGKIEANSLSHAVADFLKIGMQKSPLVAQFFSSWKNPIYGDQIAVAFKNKYIALRDAVPDLHPDEIFGRLEEWAGGHADTTPTHKAAVLAVMAYLFDKCEIFEDALTVRQV
jgi:hypothetical protein